MDAAIAPPPIDPGADASAAVTNVNDHPTGSVTISAAPVEPGDADTTDTVFSFTIDGQMGNGMGLTANTDAIADEDGLGAFRYQWQRSTDSGDFEDIPNATGQSYILGGCGYGSKPAG